MDVNEVLEITRKKREIFREKNESIILKNPAPDDSVIHEDFEIEVTGAAKTRIQSYVMKEYNDLVLPVYICMHGGGYICGSGDFDDKYCRLTALNVRCRVINIDYKLSPEYKFPYQIEECYGTILWIIRHAEELKIDPDKIMVGGHSAGAGLSTNICAMAAKRKDFNICGQVLDYPPVDFVNSDYWTELPEGVDLVNKDYSGFFNTCYLKSEEDKFSPYTSTLLIEDFSDFPPAIIVLAENDALSAPAQQYAEKLKAAGIYTEVYIFKDCNHGFMTLPMEGTQAAFDEGWQARWKFMNRYFD